MKRILIAVLAALTCISSYAIDKDFTLMKIESTNLKYKTIQAKFDQKRTLPSKATAMRAGDFYYSAPDKMSMLFTEPATDKFIISDGKMLNILNGKPAQRFDLAKAPAMASFADCLLKSMSGEVRKVAEANNAEIEVSDDAKFYVVTLTAKTKAVKGFSKMVLKYRKTDCVLVEMEMEEFNKMVNLYVLKDISKDTAIDNSVYNLK